MSRGPAAGDGPRRGTFAWYEPACHCKSDQHRAVLKNFIHRLPGPAGEPIERRQATAKLNPPDFNTAVLACEAAVREKLCQEARVDGPGGVTHVLSRGRRVWSPPLPGGRP